jgi:hypothetical protein
MIPKLNVNLKPCHCPHASFNLKHWEDCPAKPAPIPCPVPRSVTFSVVRGECMCTVPDGDTCWTDLPSHAPGCHARPFSVSCSIRGETWETSTVAECEVQEGTPNGVRNALYEACRARWGIVKALALGETYTLAARFSPTSVDAIHRLHLQRDEVYAGLADLAQLERGACNAQQRVEGAFPYHRFHRVGGGDHRAIPPSHARLAAYVEFLVEQVGVLP